MTVLTHFFILPPSLHLDSGLANILRGIIDVSEASTAGKTNFQLSRAFVVAQQ